MGTGNKTGVRGLGSEVRKTAILYITQNGLGLARRLKQHYPEAQIIKYAPKSLPEIWSEHRNLIFIMASGIVVRTIAPLIKDKKTDPAVVVMDEKGRHAISLLSGHLGGANALAKEIADRIGGDAVITTASDVNGLSSLDVWAQDNGLLIESWELVPQTATRFINKGTLKVYIDQGIDIKLPTEFIHVDRADDADVVISNKLKISPAPSFSKSGSKQQIYMRPRNLVIGIGCNRGTPAKEIDRTVKKTLNDNNLSFASVHSISTIDIKSDEGGLLDFARKYGFDIRFFTKDDLNRTSSAHNITGSKAAMAATGATAVAEPAALRASGAGTLLVPKKKQGNVTVAAAERKLARRPEVRGRKKGASRPLGTHSKLYIVCIGPGAYEHITPAAKAAIDDADVIVGYKTYVDLIRDWVRDKEVVSTAMRQEVDRCAAAIEIALTGKKVAVICSGDPGIYAMAGLVFEILKGQRSEGRDTGTRVSDTAAPFPFAPDVEVIPGISALNACAARLGAPLMHDLASISLSDLLTPWPLIEKRIDAASSADFVIVIYNPKSRGRRDHIKKARDIILKHRSPATPVGIVRGAMREGETVVVTDLKNMLRHDIDMQSTVIIGNSQTFVWDGRMVTPRGYGNKYSLKRDDRSY